MRTHTDMLKSRASNASALYIHIPNVPVRAGRRGMRTHADVLKSCASNASAKCVWPSMDLNDDEGSKSGWNTERGSEAGPGTPSEAALDCSWAFGA